MMIAMIRMMTSRRKIGGNKKCVVLPKYIFIESKTVWRWSPFAHHADIGGEGNGSIAPRVLNLDSSWKWVVSLTRRSLYTGDRSPWFCFPLNRRVSEPVWILGRRKDISWFGWQSYQCFRVVQFVDWSLYRLISWLIRLYLIWFVVLEMLFERGI